MQAVRRAATSAPGPGNRARYCRRCGAPLSLASGAMGGVRCMACGATPGVPIRSSADLGQPSVRGEPNARLTAVPMGNRPPSASGAPSRSAPVALRRAATASRALGRRLMDDPPSLTMRTWITGAAAAVGIALAILVALAIG